MKKALIILGSPRKNGNSDTLGKYFSEGLTEVGVDFEILAIRDYKILACTGCNFCAKNRNCILAKNDDCAEIFAKLLETELIFFCSPIYFYGLPGYFKSFIDRAQLYYGMNLEKFKQKYSFAGLVAGRKQGLQLFDSAKLTLKYFSKCFNANLEESFCIKGFDEINAVKNDKIIYEQAKNYAKQVC